MESASINLGFFDLYPELSSIKDFANSVLHIIEIITPEYANSIHQAIYAVKLMYVYLHCTIAEANAKFDAYVYYACIWIYYILKKIFEGMCTGIHDSIFFFFNFIRNFIVMNMVKILDSFFFLFGIIDNIKSWLFTEHAFLFFFMFFILTNLVSFIIISYLGMYGTFFFNLIPLVLFWISAVNLWFEFLQNANKIIIWNLGTWITLNMNYKVEFLFYIDLLSFSYMLLTTSIAVFVYIYAFSYFRYEPHVDRLLVMLNLFVISMIILVLAGNFVILFLGWELIGLTSFFLINFWNTRQSTVKAGFKAFVFNRISDVVLFFLCIYTFFIVNDCTISVILDVFLKKNFNVFGDFNPINIFSVLIIVPVCVKSAQIFAHIWLPDSMEAPVPASALIHSATLVSAGVYLLLRFKAIIVLSLPALIILPVIGGITAVYGAVTSAFQTDVKRLLAYSTISHCGFLVLSAVLCDMEFTILYLYVHGFFKAASFICIGNVIRFNLGRQDIRNMGGFAFYLPFEASILAICLLFLAGAPFTFGFFMKHFLVSSLVINNVYILFIYSVTFIAAVFGLVYCSRLYYGIFFGTKRSYKSVYLTVSRKKFYEFDKDSQYYTNSTIAALFAIFGLMLCSLFMCFVLLLFIYNKHLNFGDMPINQSSVAYNILTNYTPVGLLFNFGFINTTMLIFIIFICSVSFVRRFQPELVFELLATILIFIIFVLIILNLLF